jgi:hypothetical protein
MMRRYLKSVAAALGMLFCGALVCLAGPAGVKTDKTAYQYGEPVKVTFSGATGLDSDWICMVPAGAPDTEGGDYKYLPKGPDTGTLTFDPPAPGKYEVRAYYNYSKVGYVVAARSAFSVTGDAAYSKAMEERMARRVNPADPLEAAVPADKGLVYVFREPWTMSSSVDVQVTVNDKPIAVLANTDYYPYVVRPGDVRFKAVNLFEAGTRTRVDAGVTGDAGVTVKPGHVYYLRVKVVPLAYYDIYLENISFQEGADMIRDYKLIMRK